MMGMTPMTPRKRTIRRKRSDSEPERSEEGRGGQETGQPQEGVELSPGAAFPASEGHGTGAIK